MHRGLSDLLKSGIWKVEFLKALRHYGNKALRRNFSYCPIALSPYCLKKAFTLAEVLITLAVIGVVAAMTMPTLIQNINEKQTVTQLKKTYSLLSQAYQRALLEEGDPHLWFDKDLSQYENEEIFYKKLKPYLKIIKDCGNEGGCFASGPAYHLGGTVHVDDFDNDLRQYNVVLTDGTGLSLYVNQCWISGNCNVLGSLTVDVNGKKGDLTYGKDLFQFEFDENKIYYSTDADTINTTCINREGNSRVGTRCEAWVLNYGNMDYLHCPEKLSWNGKHTCK